MTFIIPDKRAKIQSQRLADFADANGMCSLDLFHRFVRYYETGQGKPFVKAARKAGIKTKKLTMADAEEAVRFNTIAFQKIQERASKIRIPVPKRKIKSNKGPDRRENSPAKKIWGYTAASVIRWMGKEGWNVEQASIALEGLGSDASRQLIKRHIVKGMLGRGSIPDLSDYEIQDLQDLIPSR